MKIITYDKDGKQKSVKEYPDFVPDYVRHFDDNKSFLNITEQDIKILAEKNPSFERFLLCSRLSFAIRFDYKNFISNVKKEGNSYSRDVLQIGNKVTATQVASLRRVIDYAYNHRKGDNTVLKVAAETLKDNTWLDVIVYLAIKNGDNLSNKRVLAKILNLLHWYHYALKRLGSNLPEELKRQMYFSYPFSYIRHRYDIIDIHQFCIDSPLFLRKIIIALYKTQEKRRSELYSLILRLSNLALSVYHDQGTIDTQLLGYQSVLKKSSQNPSFLMFTGYGANDYGISMDEAELIAFGSPLTKNNKSKEHILEDISKLLNTVYNEYAQTAFITSGWKKELTNDIQNYRIQTNCNVNNYNWRKFYVQWIDDIKNRYSSSEMQAPQCYLLLLVSMAQFGKHIEFTNDVSAKVIYLRYINQKDSLDDQRRLYEGKYKIDYINDKIVSDKSGNTKYSSIMMQAILAFVEPICNAKFLMKKVLSIFKDLLTWIITDKEFINDMQKTKHYQTLKDTRFKEDFNIGLLYNILSVLVKYDNPQIFRIKKAAMISRNLLQTSGFVYDEKKDNLRKQISDPLNNNRKDWNVTREKQVTALVDEFLKKKGLIHED